MEHTPDRLQQWFSGLGGGALWLGHQVGPYELGYWVPLVLSVTLLLLASLARLRGRPVQDRYFLLLLACVVVAGRWPQLIRLEIDADESQALAGALALARDPVFFRSVDGTTHGPFLYYALLLPHLLGLPLDYGLARAVGLGCDVAALLLTYLAARRLAGPERAGLAAVPAALLLAGTCEHFMVSYGSENVPNLLLSLATWLLCVRPRGWFGWLGLLLGALPYAKLQVVPLGAFLGVTGLWLCRGRARELATLVGTTFIVPALFTAVLAATGSLGDFWQSYLGSNAAYTRYVRMVGPYEVQEGLVDGFTILGFFTPSLGERIGVTAGWLGRAAAVRWQVLGPLILAGVALARPRTRTLAGLALVYYGLAFAVAALPGSAYSHYFRLMMFPAVLLAAVSLRDLPAAAGVAWLVLTGLPLVRDLEVPRPNQERLPSWVVLRQARDWPNIGLHLYSKELLKLCGPGERVAVWGWLPYLWVETGTVPGTRDLVCERQLEPRFDWGYFRARYLRDLKAEPPAVIVDAVGSNMYKEREKYGLEAFPELMEYVSANYHLAAEVHRVRYFLINTRRTP